MHTFSFFLVFLKLLIVSVAFFMGHPVDNSFESSKIYYSSTYTLFSKVDANGLLKRVSFNYLTIFW